MNTGIVVRLTVMAFALCRPVIGATVLWDSFGLVDMSEFTSTSSYLIGYDGAGGSFYADIFLVLDGNGNSRTLSGTAGVTGFSGKWIIADAGTVLDMVSFGNYDRPLVETRLTVSTGTSSQMDVPGNIFLAVQVEKLTGENVNFDDPRMYSGEYLYGWVSLNVDGAGKVTLLGSAIDLDGGPMVVGGGAWNGNIPEPSGGMLFLLGAAALGLRRKRIGHLSFSSKYLGNWRQQDQLAKTM